MQAGSKIAVAGATGRVGRHLVEVLKAQGHDVVAMSRSSGVDVTLVGEGRLVLTRFDTSNTATTGVVSIRVAQVTAGIRGTDFWGRSRDDRQVVCLIEGAIDVGADGEKPVRMDKPLQFYQRDKGKTQPVGQVDPKQLEQWGRETEIEAGKGAARRGGKFMVELATLDSQSAAGAISRQLQEAGYPAQVAQRKEGEKVTYTVRIRQLPSREEAQILANRLKGKFGVKEPKVAG